MLNRELFGQRLKGLRLQKGISQTALAKDLGITPTQISDMEKGKTTTSLDRLVLICQILDTSADYLLGLRDTPKDEQSGT
ncbi:MAG TPA: helix-turn-helix transcriptional regulator [Candidatus Merdivicinus intestinigallinarum]|nr:helix-turn-helix transcriptional regulator [Candidatus Merdivicinus intestinigallinarum]